MGEGQGEGEGVLLSHLLERARVREGEGETLS